MFLMKLRPEEKFAFLHIAHFIATSDGELEKRENEIIEEYCMEMGIDNIIFDINLFDLEKELQKFKSRQSQKILLMELMVLIHADDIFAEKEHHIVDNVAEIFGFDPITKQHFSHWGKAVNALYSQGKLFSQSLS